MAEVGFDDEVAQEEFPRAACDRMGSLTRSAPESKTVRDAVDEFAAHAQTWREWVLRGENAGEVAARKALVQVTRLYLSALLLPTLPDEELPSENETPTLGAVEESIYRRLGARLPLGSYGKVFDPLADPREDPLVGDVADDLAAIFFEVDEGLRMYEAGRRAEAIWQWNFMLVHHWGEHATSAIRALHCYLAAHHPALLAAPAEQKADGQ